MREGILVVGTTLVDNICEVSKYPNKGELTKVLNLKKSVGGQVPNMAIDLKRIDKNLNVAAIGKIMNDENGKYVLERLKEESVDVSKMILSDDDKTSFTNVISEVNGERTFFTYPGSSSALSYEDIDFTKINEKMLHLGYFLLLDRIDNGDGIKILKKANELGIKTSIDLVSENSDRYKIVIPCLKHVDNLIINEVEASNLTGIRYSVDSSSVILRTLKEYGVRDNVIIHEKDRSFILSKNGITSLESLKLENDFVKGTTGAGDAFASGALYAIYNGFSDKQILDFASRVAAMSLREADAVSGILSYDEIMEYTKKFRRQ